MSYRTLQIKVSSLPFTSLLTLFLCLMAGSLLAYNAYNVLPSGPLIELLVLIFLCASVSSFDTRMLMFVTASSLYLFYSLSSFYLDSRFFSLSDFLLAYKSFVYVIFLSFIHQGLKVNERNLRLFYNVLIAIFIIKYSIWFLAPSQETLRPGVFAENNFEIMWLLNSLEKITVNIERQAVKLEQKRHL